MPLAQLREFVETLKQSGLLEREQLAEVRDTVSRETVPSELAGDLVERGWITFWQAQQLLAGVTTFYLGKYKLLQKLGEGGMGAVYQAEQARIKRLVALKVLNERRMHNPAAVRRFQREVQALATLNHPHIITAYDADRVENTFFLVMEYLEGRDLGRWLRDYRQLPLDWACECVRQAALGLQHAFERDLVHRDIKPSNLLVCAGHAGEPPLLKILDLGLARLKNDSDEDKLTKTDEIMGTPDYIAPEQAGDTSSADIRADIYSLGCVLYELLTGEVPFTGRNVMEKLMARGLRPAPLASNLRREISPDLDEIIATMLARNPNKRFQTPAEVAEAIEPFAWQASQSIQLQLPLRNREPLNEQAQVDASLEQIRHRLAPEARSEDHDLELAEAFADTNGHSDSSLNALVEAVSTVAGQDCEPTPPLSEQPAIEDEESPSEAVDLAETDEPASSIVELPSTFETVNKPPESTTSQSNTPGTTSWLLLSIVGVALVGLLGWAGSFWAEPVLVFEWPPAEREDARLQIDGNQVEFPLEGPFRLPIESGSHRVVIQRRGFQAFETTLEVGLGEQVTVQPSWRPVNSPQGIREPIGEIAAQPGWQAYREALTEQIDAEAQSRQQAWEELAAELRPRATLSWDHPQVQAAYRELLAFRQRYPQQTSEAQQATQLLATLPSKLDSLPAQAFSNVWPLVDEQAEVLALLGRPLPHWGKITSLAFSEDSQRLASGGEGGLVHVWNANTGEHLRSFQGHQAAITCLDFHPDGQRLASASRDGRVYLWDLVDDNNHTNFDLHAGVRSLDISPDGRWLAAGLANHNVRLYDFQNDQLKGLPRGHWHSVGSVQFSPDSQYLLTAASDKQLLCWDVHSRERVRDYERPAIPFGFIEFSEDGQKVYATTKHLRQYVYRLDSKESLRDWQLRPNDSERLLTTQNQQICVITAEEQSPSIPLTGDKPRSVMRHLALPLQPQTIETGLVSNDGQFVALTQQGQDDLYIYSTEEGRSRVCGPPPNAKLHSAALLGTGEEAISGHDSGELRLWDVCTQQYQLLANGHSDAITRLAVAADGTWFVAGSAGGTLSLHLAENQWQAQMIDGHLSRLIDLAISPTGNVWASTDSAGMAKLWKGKSVEMLEQVSIENSQLVSALTFSPEGRLLLLGTNQQLIYGYRLGSDELPFSLAKLPDTLHRLAFGPYGETLWGVPKEFHAVRRWNWQEGQRAGIFNLHQPQTLSLKAVPGGLLTAGRDGTVRLWPPQPKEKPSHHWRLGPGDGKLRHLSLSTNGRYAAVCGENDLIYVFRLPPLKED